MKKYAYTIKKHSFEEFKELVFFCSEKGECSVDHVPQQQIEKLTTILNDMGSRGYELVQLLYGKDGLMTIWQKPAE